jgi:hypothetical protein
LINYGKIYSKFPRDNYVKNHYYKLQREYNKLRKFKYRQYKQTLINQLDSLHDNNPKLYWNLINDLRQQKEKDQSGSVVDTPSWVSHFEK